MNDPNFFNNTSQMRGVRDGRTPEYLNNNATDLIDRYRDRLNDDDAQWPSFREVPDFDVAAQTKRIHLDEFYFPFGIKSSCTTFSNSFSLASALVQGPILFEDVKFLKDVNLERINTGINANITFKNCIFSKNLNIKSTHLFASIVFSNCSIFNVDFTHSKFTSGADFRTSTFRNFANFRSASFGPSNQSDSITGFREVKFKGSVTFERTVFGDDADFQLSEFSEEADFTNATFSSVASFHDAKFQGKVDFSNAQFDGQLRFDNVKFSGAVPKFFEAKLHQDTRFTTTLSLWPTPDEGSAHDGVEAYTRLRQIMSDLKKPEEEHFFFRQEFNCKALIGSFWERLPIRLFRRVSNFGHGLKQPIVGLSLLWLIPAIIFWINSACFEGSMDYIQSAALSFANIFKFLGFHSLYVNEELVAKLPWGLKFLSGAQTAVGFTLIFFLGLGLRNRFRLR
ncbi:MAG: pentapeptide repeat-containing protein [Rhodobacteraceae bacterium]|nr:pentapeptide repeat-containing protein [Paracoccaceae bacterium]